MTDKLLDRITWNLECKASVDCDKLAAHIDSICPSLKNSSLETKALRVALSIGAQSVSIGVRDPNLIAPNLNVLRYEPMAKDEVVNLLTELNKCKDEFEKNIGPHDF